MGPCLRTGPATLYFDDVGVAPAEGWYRDPYAIHEDRWMSEGRATKVVRDGGTESYDPPPDLPLPDVLVPSPTGSGASANGSDLRRADAACDGATYSGKRARRAAIDAMGGGAIIDEPGGIW